MGMPLGGGGPAFASRFASPNPASALSSKLSRRFARPRPIAMPIPPPLLFLCRKLLGGVAASATLPAPMEKAVPVLALDETLLWDETGARSSSAGTFSPR